MDRIIQGLPVYGADSPGKSSYIGQCNSNITASIVFMVGFGGILLWFAHYTLIGWVAFIAALIFPISMLFWYYQKKTCANYYFDKKNSHDNKRAVYQDLREGLSKRASETVNRIINNSAREIVPFQSTSSTVVDQAANLDGLVIGNFQFF